jgi:hypothetical protein
MKIEVGRNWYQSIQLPSVLLGAPMDTITRRAKSFQRIWHILILSQPVGLVIFLSCQISMCGFSVTASVRVKKITIVEAEIFLDQPTKGSVYFL